MEEVISAYESTSRINMNEQPYDGWFSIPTRQSIPMISMLRSTSRYHQPQRIIEHERLWSFLLPDRDKAMTMK